MSTPDVAIARAEMQIRTGIGQLRDLFRPAGQLDKIDAVLEAVVALERITYKQQPGGRTVITFNHGKVSDLGLLGAGDRDRTGNLPITSRVRCQLRHAGLVTAW